MPSESQQIMAIVDRMNAAEKQQEELKQQMDAAADEGVDVSVPMSVFQEIQERR